MPAVAAIRYRPRRRAWNRQSRTECDIDIHALRLGDSPGEHTVIFGMLGEVIELSHRASNRDGFARGALDAAKFLAGKPPRLYSMEDVLA